MPKIMHVLTDTNIGGAGIWLCNFAKSNIKQKHQIVAVLPQNSMLCPRIRAEGIEVIELDKIADRSFSPESIGEIKKTIKEQKPDIVHTHASLSARIAAKMCGVPVVHTRHCLEGKKPFPKNIVYRIINNFLSSAVIGVSKAVTKNLEDDGIKPSKLHLVYNGINPVKEYTPEEKAAARNRLGIPPDVCVAALVARLESVKNPLLFVKAAHIAASHNPDIHFLVAGDGSLRSEVEKEAKPLGENFHITGYLENVADAYNAMDILTLTSESEALSISLIEGQSAGLPVISTDSGGPSEIITQGENGIIVPNGDAESLAKAILSLADNPQKRKAFGESGKQNVAKRFGLDVMSDEIDKIYKSLTDKSKGRRK